MDKSNSTPDRLTKPILEARGIRKRFPGVLALDDVHISLYPGEVLAIIGENGAGKSTLMKILGGVYSPDSGEIFIQGQKVVIDSVGTALSLRISLIHQELNLSDNLDIGANVFLGRESYRFGPLRLAKRREIYQKSEIILKRLGIKSSPKTLVRNLTIGQQQMIEIAKALSVNAQILIMDEPTSSLSLHETENLFKVINDLKSQGVSLIYISHRLGEVKEIADRVIVLRDGKNSGEIAHDEIDRERMIKLMVGREIVQFYHHRQHYKNNPVFQVKDLILRGKHNHPINFSINEGEILGLAGLVGAGRTELAQTLFGINPMVSGSISIDGKDIHIKSPQDAIRAGLALVPEDRKLQGLILELAVWENITLAGLYRLNKMGIVLQNKINELAREMTKHLDIRTPGINQEVQYLSGGNQQKVVLAKWLSLKPRVLLLDEPTRGIDIVAKEEIYRLMERLSEEGVAILMISSEMQEVLGISDRILVMHDGTVTGELREEKMTEESIMHYATGAGK